eukprot:CAMPEP_0196598750 /NCGR_PEP_ID=MMETSP1081-20130531/94488_1 /TAXON_ID=36882 /ORGANISM="Pyramimonas amylifera, Strain CCMP720" /LENGTH=209 /DNA_ID=CAMNT_0041924469 /DNA_START=736 /DNA_END=1366 /DNA_ORIENTATION=-
MESNVGVRLSDASFPVLIDIMDSAATLEDAARQIDVLLEQYNVTYSNGSLVQTLLASSPQFENGAVESNVDPVMMRAANQTTAEETVQGLMELGEGGGIEVVIRGEGILEREVEEAGSHNGAFSFDGRRVPLCTSGSAQALFMKNNRHDSYNPSEEDLPSRINMRQDLPRCLPSNAFLSTKHFLYAASPTRCEGFQRLNRSGTDSSKTR